MQTVPDFGNDVFRFKVARGILKDFPEVEVTIRMRTWTANSKCQIEVEQYGHEQDIGLATEQVVRNAKIFAKFKTHMLGPRGQRQAIGKTRSAKPRSRQSSNVRFWP
ncbi:hypothetical protein CWO90_08805 [Bradyrhizobium sp. Leo121]|nr:hypothetical protein CWO90_08805 [Bradyrhizobium sp. Leo121]